jgi:hypothetical protein
VGGRRRSSCRWRRCGDLEAQGAQRSGEKREGTEGNPRGCLPWMGRGGRRPTTASHGGRLGPQGAAMPRRCGGDGEGLRRCSATRRSSWTRRLRLWRFDRRNRVAAVLWPWPAAHYRRRRNGGPPATGGAADVQIGVANIMAASPPSPGVPTRRVGDGRCELDRRRWRAVQATPRCTGEEGGALAAVRTRGSASSFYRGRGTAWSCRARQGRGLAAPAGTPVSSSGTASDG